MPFVKQPWGSFSWWVCDSWGCSGDWKGQRRQTTYLSQVVSPGNTHWVHRFIGKFSQELHQEESQASRMGQEENLSCDAILEPGGDSEMSSIEARKLGFHPFSDIWLLWRSLQNLGETTSLLQKAICSLEPWALAVNTQNIVRNEYYNPGINLCDIQYSNSWNRKEEYTVLGIVDFIAKVYLIISN